MSGGGCRRINDRRKKTCFKKQVFRIGRRERIRTSDPLVPNQLRYQAALLADSVVLILQDFKAHVYVIAKIYMTFCVVRREGLEPSRP